MAAQLCKKSESGSWHHEINMDTVGLFRSTSPGSLLASARRLANRAAFRRCTAGGRRRRSATDTVPRAAYARAARAPTRHQTVQTAAADVHAPRTRLKTYRTGILRCPLRRNDVRTTFTTRAYFRSARTGGGCYRADVQPGAAIVDRLLFCFFAAPAQTPEQRGTAFGYAAVSCLKRPLL